MFSVVSLADIKETAACGCKRLSEKFIYAALLQPSFDVLLDESIACTCYACYVHPFSEGAYVNAL